MPSGGSGVADLPVPPPLAPMLARLVSELPGAGPHAYEPKWDGFRCLAFRGGDEVDLRSRNDRPLARYFPEVVEALLALPTQRVVLDGEVLVTVGGRADFSALLGRLHPAASRVERLSRESPATYVAFDLLALDDRELLDVPFRERRGVLEAVLEGVPPPLVVTPATRDPEIAGQWLEGLPGGGADGVVVKADDLHYQPGRRVMVKVKRARSVDCVVAGFRLLSPTELSSLLLGLYAPDGVLHHVGVVTSLPKAQRAALLDALAPLVAPLHDHPWEQGFGLEGGSLGRLKGTAGRWTPDMPRDWVPLRPERVAEVSYDHLEGQRFRHPARLLRWRPDRDAASCRLDQLTEPQGAGEP
jgi:ATP-dependent DNA ligase